MDLILWRHAEAEDGLNDLARALTEKGHRQAVKISTFLHHHLPANTRILVSPAIRTQQTAAALTDKFTTIHALAPDASVDAVLHAAHWPGDNGCVLIVGHQPTLGAVASHLLRSEQPSLRLKKSGLWWFSQQEDTTEVFLRLAITPEFL